MDLFNRSIEIILKNQHRSGAYIASPSFPTYAYSWFRDGSYIAYAMDRVGQYESSRCFHVWCAQVIARQSGKIKSLVARKKEGEVLKPEEFLTARYSLEGFPTRDDWTDFQLDGYGTWLWAVNEYYHRSKDESLLEEISYAVDLLLQYLINFWDSPCYDCWEEHLEAIHPYTLAAISAGLEAAKKLNIPGTHLPISETVASIGVYLKEKTIHPEGYVRKLIFPNNAIINSELITLVDASLIGLAVPYETPVVDQDIVRATIQKIEEDLYFPNGGVYRYLDDTYYGGGEWILLAAWLGWYWCQDGEYDKAIQMKSFIQEKADDNGNLPEQVSDHLLAPSYYAEWVNRWGEIAKPLLWSHAMYIVLCDELMKYDQRH